MTTTFNETLGGNGERKEDVKRQKLMEDEFGVSAKNNDKLAGISNISEILGSGDSAEND